MSLIPVEINQNPINNLSSTSTLDALSANQGNRIYEWLRTKGIYIQSNNMADNVPLRTSGQMIYLGSCTITQGTYTTSSTLHYGNYYYVNLGYITHENLKALFNNSNAILSEAGSSYLLGITMGTEATTGNWATYTSYLFKPTATSAWYLINTKFRSTSAGASITIAHNFILEPVVNIWTSFDILPPIS